MKIFHNYSQKKNENRRIMLTSQMTSWPAYYLNWVTDVENRRRSVVGSPVEMRLDELCKWGFTAYVISELAFDRLSTSELHCALCIVHFSSLVQIIFDVSVPCFSFFLFMSQ